MAAYVEPLPEELEPANTNVRAPTADPNDVALKPRASIYLDRVQMRTVAPCATA